MNVEESADQILFQSIGDRKQLEATKSQHGEGGGSVPCPWEHPRTKRFEGPLAE